MKTVQKNRTLMHALVFISILAYIEMPAFAQGDQVSTYKIDSLKAALVGATGLNQYNILDQLAYEYLEVVDSIALDYARAAFNLSWQFSDSARIVKSGRFKAMALHALASYDSAISLASSILPVARRNNYLTEIKHLLNIMALAHTHKAEYDRALVYNFESLELRKKYENDFSVSIALNNIGLVYYKIDNLVQAAHYFEKALSLRSVNGETLPNVDKAYYVSSFTNLSLCYSYMNNLKMAEDYLEKAYVLCKDTEVDYMLMPVHFASGLLNFKHGNLEKASTLFQESLSLARKISDRRFELENLIYLSEISIRLSQLREAEAYLLQAEPLFESGIPFKLELAQVYDQLSKVYEKLGNYRKCATFQSKYIELREKVYTTKLTINLMTVQAEYLELENRAKIEAQENVLLLNKDVIKKQRALNVIIGIVAVLSLALVFALVQNVRQKRQANLLLEQRVKERTIELDLNHNLLLKSLHERDVQFQKMSMEIKSSLATIKGLGVLVSHDVNTIHGSNYLAKIEETSNNLIQGLSRVHNKLF